MKAGEEDGKRSVSAAQYNHRHSSKEEVATDLEDDEGEIYRQKLISISYQEIPRLCESSLPNGV